MTDKKPTVLSVKAAHPEWSASQIAAHLGLSKDSVQKTLRRSPLVFSDDAQPLTIPGALHATGDRMIISDVHAPNTDPKMIDKVLETGSNLGLTTLDVVGDLFNMDVFSIHNKTRIPSVFSREVKSARETLRHLHQQFKTVRWCRGNHDQRLSVLTFGQVDMEMLVGMVSDDPIEVSARNYMYAESGGTKWLLTHQFKYARNPLVVAGALAERHHANVISTHEHHCGMSKSKDGRWTIVNNPCLCRGLEYVEENISDMPEMELGFTVLMGGRVNQYIEGALFGIE